MSTYVYVYIYIHWLSWVTLYIHSINHNHAYIYIYIFEDICMYIYIHMCYHGLLNIYIPLIIIMHTYICIFFEDICMYIYIYTQGLSWVPSYIHSINHHYDIYIYVLVLCIVASVLDPYGLSVCVISPVKYGVYKYIYIHTDAVMLFF